MKGRGVVIWVLVIGLALCAGWSARTFLAMYDCLDAGGRWSARDQCESVFSEM
ncbi:hypothetical protein [Brevundimonas lenta]|uniref:Uncharacterized protein n=1 Tax=Brevundimonas lenta TaxID=424796 RepID=A0A7W6NPQ0_9CAUL|nr:hypothetical protein [Brevundimonas lenta]MBB4082400.1 hypothetical protein [Brevundimonas lenta]